MTDDIDHRVRCVTCANLRHITCLNAVPAGLSRRRRTTEVPRDFIVLRQHCGGYRSAGSVQRGSGAARPA